MTFRTPFFLCVCIVSPVKNKKMIEMEKLFNHRVSNWKQILGRPRRRLLSEVFLVITYTQKRVPKWEEDKI